MTKENLISDRKIYLQNNLILKKNNRNPQHCSLKIQTKIKYMQNKQRKNVKRIKTENERKFLLDYKTFRFPLKIKMQKFRSKKRKIEPQTEKLLLIKSNDILFLKNGF